MNKIKVFYEINPGKDKRCCGNCKSFNLWGCSTGYCSLKDKDKQANQACKEFDKQLIPKEIL